MIITNKKAYHEYYVNESIECGIQLTGNEIKSVRKAEVSLKESWVTIDKSEVFIKNMYIKQFDKSYNFNILDERRNRKLLLHRREITKLQSSLQLDGYTIIPLKLYINNRGKCKVVIGICKGKHLYDKRKAEKDKVIKREIERSIHL